MECPKPSDQMLDKTIVTNQESDRSFEKFFIRTFLFKIKIITRVEKNKNNQAILSVVIQWTITLLKEFY